MPSWKPTNGIKHYRLRLNLTQAELAEKVGVSQKTVSFWERWHEKPSEEQGRLMALVLGCSVGELVQVVFPGPDFETDEHKMRRGRPRRPARYWMTEKQEDER